MNEPWVVYLLFIYFCVCSLLPLSVFGWQFSLSFATVARVHTNKANVCQTFKIRCALDEWLAGSVICICTLHTKYTVNDFAPSQNLWKENFLTGIRIVFRPMAIFCRCWCQSIYIIFPFQLIDINCEHFHRRCKYTTNSWCYWFCIQLMYSF